MDFNFIISFSFLLFFLFLFLLFDNCNFKTFFLLLRLRSDGSSSPSRSNISLDLASEDDFLIFCQFPWFNAGLLNDVEKPIWVDKHRFSKYAYITNHAKILNYSTFTSISTRSIMLKVWIDKILQISISSGRIILEEVCSTRKLWIYCDRLFIVVFLLTRNSYFGDNVQFSWSQVRT